MRLVRFIRSHVRRRAVLAAIVVGLSLVTAAPSVLAQCQTNQNCWPPPGGCAYPAPGPTFYPLFVPVGVRNVELHDPNACAIIGAASESFFDIFVDLEFSPDGGSSWTPHGLPPGPCRVHLYPPVPVGQDLLFPTEMLQLDLHGLPSGALIRESPTLASTGRTTQRDLGGGHYWIDSFFDVFTELSPDGGQSWVPAEQPLHLTTIDLSPTPTRAGTWGTVKVRYR